MYQQCLSENKVKLQSIIDDLKRKSFEIDPETEESNYVQQMTEIEDGRKKAMFHKCMAQELLGEVIEQFARQSVYEFLELQSEFKKLCERRDIDGTH